MSDLRVVLASRSPRRHDLLDLIGITHDIEPADIDERVRGREAPRKHAERLAREKASAAAGADRNLVAIGADTIVLIDGKILGKPANAVDAGTMLSLLSGREHTVVTAIAVARGKRVRSAVEEVSVKFRKLSDDEIDAYIATGEPMDKAGAYGIQGYGATIVERIKGDYFSVMGLSLVRLVTLLKELGVGYAFGKLTDLEISAEKRPGTSAAQSVTPTKGGRMAERRPDNQTDVVPTEDRGLEAQDRAKRPGKGSARSPNDAMHVDAPKQRKNAAGRKQGNQRDD
jgi:septum formation protein